MLRHKVKLLTPLQPAFIARVLRQRNDGIQSHTEGVNEALVGETGTMTDRGHVAALM